MDTDLRSYSTFKIGGSAFSICKLKSDEDIVHAHRFATDYNKPLIIIGEGSNSIFGETNGHYVIGHMHIRGITAKSKGDKVLITVGAGESWDGLISQTVDQGLTGIEALSWIPGTVGAAPVQNIGAYGSEIADTLVSVRAFDRTTERFTVLSAQECQFSYRDSIFKQRPHRYVITHITLALTHAAPPIPQYKAVQERFMGTKPIVAQIRSAIIEIRQSKLPDVRALPNCGSFFKNPVVTREQLRAIQKDHPAMPFFEIDTQSVKLYAGWLIEHIDYASCESENIRLYEKNKLVLTNHGGATFQELERVISCLTNTVARTFGVTLEVEPNIYR